MFNIGPFELMVILLLALVVVGPSRLPEVGRSIGKGLRELRKVQDEVRDSINFDLDAEPAPRTRTPRPRTPRPASSTAGPRATPATPIEPEAPAVGTSPGAAIDESPPAPPSEPSDPSPPEPSSPGVAPEAAPSPGSPNGSTPTPEPPAE